MALGDLEQVQKKLDLSFELQASCLIDIRTSKRFEALTSCCEQDASLQRRGEGAGALAFFHVCKRPEVAAVEKIKPLGRVRCHVTCGGLARRMLWPEGPSSPCWRCLARLRSLQALPN